MCAEGSVAESRGGVRPVDWVTESSVGNTASGNPKELIVLIAKALNDYDVVWAAAGTLMRFSLQLF